MWSFKNLNYHKLDGEIIKYKRVNIYYYDN